MPSSNADNVKSGPHNALGHSTSKSRPTRSRRRAASGLGLVVSPLVGDHRLFRLCDRCVQPPRGRLAAGQPHAHRPRPRCNDSPGRYGRRAERRGRARPCPTSAAARPESLSSSDLLWPVERMRARLFEDESFRRLIARRWVFRRRSVRGRAAGRELGWWRWTRPPRATASSRRTRAWRSGTSMPVASTWRVGSTRC